MFDWPSIKHPFDLTFMSFGQFHVEMKKTFPCQNIGVEGDQHRYFQ